MSLFKNETITIKNIPVVLADGKYTNGETTTRTIKANIQQIDPDEKQNETYGGKVKKLIFIATNENIEIDEYVTYGDEDYIIKAKRNYTAQKLVKLANIQATGVIFND